MRALILAGGLGTRLRGVLPNTPKPMAPVGGRPFLEYLILELRLSGISDIVLSVGHLSSQIEAHFGSGHQLDVELVYSKETSPLGTGGAILLARPLLDAGTFLVLNGDSFLDLELRALVDVHGARRAMATMALTLVPDNTRYGSVQMDSEGKVVGFTEKGEGRGSGLINSGIYCLEPSIFDRFPSRPGPLSLEREVFPMIIGDSFYGHRVSGFFRDIGVPEDYQAMCDDPSPLIRATRARSPLEAT